MIPDDVARHLTEDGPTGAVRMAVAALSAAGSFAQHSETDYGKTSFQSDITATFLHASTLPDNGIIRDPVADIGRTLLATIEALALAAAVLHAAHCTGEECDIPNDPAGMLRYLADTIEENYDDNTPEMIEGIADTLRGESPPRPRSADPGEEMISAEDAAALEMLLDMDIPLDGDS